MGIVIYVDVKICNNIIKDRAARGIAVLQTFILYWKLYYINSNMKIHIVISSKAI